MLFILIAATLILLLSILGIVLVQVCNEWLRQRTMQWLVKSGSNPFPDEPDNPANLIYMNDMAFNVRIVASFLLALLALLMLAVIVALAGVRVIETLF